MPQGETVAPLAEIERRILTVRGQKVILDSDLAHLHGVQTRVLNQAVTRNPEKFPGDFVFQLTSEEDRVLTSQIARSKAHGTSTTQATALHRLPGGGGEAGLLEAATDWVPRRAANVLKSQNGTSSVGGPDA